MGTNSSSSQDDIEEDRRNFENEGEIYDEQSSVEIVMKKLRKFGFEKRMTNTDFRTISKALSDKDHLLQSFLSDDFDRIKTVYKSIQSMVVENDVSSEDRLRKKYDLEPIDERSFSGNSEDLNEGDDFGEEDKFHLLPKRSLEFEDKLIFESLSVSPLKVGLLIIESNEPNSSSTTEHLTKSVKEFFSPFKNFHSPPYPLTFGYFKFALLLGPFLLEFDPLSSLVIPRVVSGEFALCSCERFVEFLLDDEQMSSILENKVADLVLEYNLAENQNDVEFIEMVIDKFLGNQSIAYPPCIKRLLTMYKTDGFLSSKKCMVSFDDEFVKRFQLEKKDFTFERHEELDIFADYLLDKDHEFEFNYRYEFRILRQYDLMFWMRWLKDKRHLKYMKDEEFQSVVHNFGPLMRDYDYEVFSSDDDHEEEEKHEEDDSNWKQREKLLNRFCKCPFGDPAKVPLMPIVKKI